MKKKHKNATKILSESDFGARKARLDFSMVFSSRGKCRFQNNAERIHRCTRVGKSTCHSYGISRGQ